MAVYNRTKKADRAREIADRQAEIEAIEAGLWPRDINDQFRWYDRTPTFTPAQWARKMCEDTIAYLTAIPGRIANGELSGWEA